MFTIEKGIPVPTTTARKGNNIELLNTMEPGDSVFFDAPIKKKATRFYRTAKHLGIKVIIRKDGEGMRMWKLGAATAAVTVVKAVIKVAPVESKKAKAKKAKPVVKQAVEKVGSKTAKAARDKRYREMKKAAAVVSAAAVPEASNV